jgi:hypothetical protein
MRPWVDNLRYVYAPGMSIFSVIDALYEEQRQGAVNLVILDYIQLFIADDRNKNEAQAISWAVQMFKNFCGQVGAHGYMGSQFNNAAIQAQGPRTQYGAKGSGDIGAKSNLVITIERKVNNDTKALTRHVPGSDRTVYIQPGERDINGTFRVDKNSFGQDGKMIPMVFDGAHYLWRDGTYRHETD